MKAHEGQYPRAIPGHELQRLLAALCLVIGLCTCATPAEQAKGDLHALSDAARKGECRELESLIEEGADVEGLDGARALAFGIAGDHAECVELLRAAGARLEARDIFGETLLHEAARLKEPGLMRFLIDRDLDLDARSRTGQTPLMIAAGVGRDGNARRLVAAGADLEARDQDGWTVLMIAVRQDRQQLAQQLIALGADVNAVSDLGWTPLEWASLAGREDLVDALLRAGADVDFAGRAGHSALILATRRGHVGVVEKLLAATEEGR
jgi:ankyrin repeat protein